MGIFLWLSLSVVLYTFLSKKMHKAGFVNIIGNPNVGKSTLMNALVGEKLSIITSKAQTTRHRIMGIVNGDDFQIVYSDTPGILKPAYKLQESMMNFVHGAVDDADVILYVTDTVEQSDRQEAIVERINRSGIPTIVVINKIDLTTPDKLEALAAEWQSRLPEAVVIPVSAKEKIGMGGVLDAILERLPEGEPFYDKDTLTDKTLRFFASEIIREKILLNYDKEIHYCCEIEIDTYKEEPTIDRISATIYVARTSQKGIVIGHKGERLKKVGQQAREDMERFLQKKVFLQLFVKVQEDWRNNERQLRRFGYDQQ
jgi:GTP-binding protein Era